MAKKDEQQFKCSFCGRPQEEVKKLIAGPSVYICDECVGLCNDIIADEMHEEIKGDAIQKLPAPKESRTARHSTCRPCAADSSMRSPPPMRS